MYCKNCGTKLDELAYTCPNCGCKTDNPYYEENRPNASKSGKNLVVAGLLALFLGLLGIHNFYLGYKKRGMVQLLLTLGSVFLFLIPFLSSMLLILFGPHIHRSLGPGFGLGLFSFVSLYTVVEVFGVGIWVLIEAVLIFLGKIPDSEGRPLV